jgi:hypothetical protein
MDDTIWWLVLCWVSGRFRKSCVTFVQWFTNQPTRVAQQLAVPTYEEIPIFRMHWTRREAAHNATSSTVRILPCSGPNQLQIFTCIISPSLTFSPKRQPSFLFSNSDLDDIFSYILIILYNYHVFLISKKFIIFN